jgi:hypothetical protein
MIGRGRSGLCRRSPPAGVLRHDRGRPPGAGPGFDGRARGKPRRVGAGYPLSAASPQTSGSARVPLVVCLPPAAGRLGRAPRAGPHRRRQVAGAAQEPRRGPAPVRPGAHLRRRQQRRRHRQPGRRLDGPVAGPVRRHHPRQHHPGGHPPGRAHARVTFSEDASAPTAGNDVASWWWGRPHTRRASATSAARCGRTTACPAQQRTCGCRTPTGPPSTGSAAPSTTASCWSLPAAR